MGHDHSHAGHSHVAPDRFSLAFMIAILANAGYVLIEAKYAYVAHSTSLLADAGHNLGDVLGLIFSWIAALLLSKKASERYSYGFKRTTIIASLTNAIVLLLSVLLILREAVEKFVHPSPMTSQAVMIVALVGILVNGGTALLFAKGAKEDLNLKSAFIHLVYDALISLGVVVIAGIIYFTQWEFLDPIAGLIIALVILWGTWSLMKDSLRLIMDGVPSNVDIIDIKDYLEKIDGVTGVHDLHVWGLSTRENALTVHLLIPARELTDTERQAIEQNLRQQFNIQHITIQIERGDGASCDTIHSCVTPAKTAHDDHDHAEHVHDHKADRQEPHSPKKGSCGHDHSHQH